MQKEDELFSSFLKGVVQDFCYPITDEVANDSRGKCEGLGYVVEWECLVE